MLRKKTYQKACRWSFIRGSGFPKIKKLLRQVEGAFRIMKPKLQIEIKILTYLSYDVRWS
jgi:hypothetical protein